MLRFAAGESPSARRREIERRAADFVAAHGGRGRLRVVARHGVDEDAPRLLRDTLQSLDGACLLFARYLASRRDLLSARFIVELESLPERAEPMDADALHDTIAASLGHAAGRFAAFDDAPFESVTAWQAHRAQLDDGRTVVVRVCRPELDGDVEHVPLLEAFGDALSPGECSAAAWRAAIQDFQDELRDALDVRHELDALEQLAADADRHDLIAAPRVHASLSQGRVLTYEPIGTTTIADRLRDDYGAGGHRASHRADSDRPNDYRAETWRHELACVVASAWLRQATLGRVFPAVVRPACIEIRGARRIAFTCGPFHAIGPQHRAALRDYLLHAVNDPDRACTGLLQQMRATPDADEEALRRRFRQTVPFRDSEWDAADDDDAFEQYLWTHWRFAAKAGFVPLPHLAAFCRGLTDVARLVQTLSPRSDALRHALTDLQHAGMARDVMDAMDPAEVMRIAGEYMQLAVVLPERIDAVLRQTSDGRARLRVGTPYDAGSRPRPIAWLLVVVLLCTATLLLGGGDAGPAAALVTKVLIVAALTAAAVVILEAWG